MGLPNPGLPDRLSARAILFNDGVPPVGDLSVYLIV